MGHSSKRTKLSNNMIDGNTGLWRCFVLIKKAVRCAMCDMCWLYFK